MNENQEILDAEEALLGGCVHDKNNYEEICGKISVDDFLSEEHQCLYTQIGNFLKEGHDKISGIMLMNYLIDHKTLASCGGQYVVTKLMSFQPLPDEFLYYFNQVKNKGTVRRLFKEFDYQKKVHEHNAIDDETDFLAKAQERIKAITDTRTIGNFQDMGDTIDKVKAKALKDAETRKRLHLTDYWLTGNSCGYSDIDKLTTGFHAGDYVLLAARPSVGKTTLMLNMACKMALRGIPVCIFSLEMSQEQIGMKLLSMVSKVPTFDINKILTGVETDGGKVFALNNAIDKLQTAPIYMEDTCQQLEDICTRVRKLKRKYPDLGMVAIDYIGLIKSNSKKSYNRQNEVSDISRALKLLAIETQLPIVALSQLSRGVETRTNHTPVLADLRDSGSLEQDADMVFFIYREDYYARQKENEPGAYTAQNLDNSSVKVLLEKNRNGSLGEVKMNFDKSTSSFETVLDEVKYSHE